MWTVDVDFGAEMDKPVQIVTDDMAGPVEEYWDVIEAAAQQVIISILHRFLSFFLWFSVDLFSIFKKWVLY